VLGGQAQLWTEYTPDAATREYRAFPRLTVLGANLWRGTPLDLVTEGPAVTAQIARLDALHVNHRPEAQRYGVLLCVNGTGSLYSWTKRTMAQGLGYEAMNELAAKAPIGSDGIVVLPFGNGAERTLSNRDPGAAILNLSFNRHSQGHLFRAAQEGVVFALNHGADIMREMGMEVRAVRAARANMFLSPVFARVFADTSGAVVELFETDGAQGAARAAGVGAGIFPTVADAFSGLRACARYEPDPATVPQNRAAYERWLEALGSQRSGW
jgi:xylulokinase